MTNNTMHFKQLLEERLTTLQNELGSVARQNPDRKGDWEATESDMNDNAAEEGDLANGMEEFENNKAVVSDLEIELTQVQNALGKIESGTFGTCEVCGGDIEEDRLEANPSAPTCKTHMNA